MGAGGWALTVTEFFPHRRDRTRFAGRVGGFGPVRSDPCVGSGPTETMGVDACNLARVAVRARRPDFWPCRRQRRKGGAMPPNGPKTGAEIHVIPLLSGSAGPCRCWFPSRAVYVAEPLNFTSSKQSPKQRSRLMLLRSKKHFGVGVVQRKEKGAARELSSSNIRIRKNKRRKKNLPPNLLGEPGVGGLGGTYISGLFTIQIWAPAIMKTHRPQGSGEAQYAISRRGTQAAQPTTCAVERTHTPCRLVVTCRADRLRVCPRRHARRGVGARQPFPRRLYRPSEQVGRRNSEPRGSKLRTDTLFTATNRLRRVQFRCAAHYTH